MDADAGEEANTLQTQTPILTGVRGQATDRIPFSLYYDYGKMHTLQTGAVVYTGRQFIHMPLHSDVFFPFSGICHSFNIAL